MKKHRCSFFALFLCVTGAFLFASCGKLFQRAKEPVSVYVPGTPEASPMLKALSENFTRKTQIAVEWHTSLSKTTDVVISDTNTFSEFAKTNSLETPDTVLKSEQQKDIFPEAFSVPLSGEKRFAVPFAARVWVLIYNQEMLRKAGYNAPPETWDAFVNEALNLKAKHISDAPVLWAWKDPREIVNAFTAITFSFGGTLFDKKGEPSFQKEQGILGLVFMKESLGRTTDPASFSMDIAAALKSYKEGKNAMMFGWHTWNAEANAGEKSKIRGRSRFTAVPGMTDGLRTALLDTAGIGILSSAPHKNSAIQFTEYLLSPEAQQEIMVRFGWLSVTRSLYADAELAEMLPLLPHYAMLMNLAKSTYKPEGNDRFTSAVYPEIALALLGKKPLKPALDAAAVKIQTARTNAL